MWPNLFKAIALLRRESWKIGHQGFYVVDTQNPAYLGRYFTTRIELEMEIKRATIFTSVII